MNKYAKKLIVVTLILFTTIFFMPQIIFADDTQSESEEQTDSSSDSTTETQTESNSSSDISTDNQSENQSDNASSSDTQDDTSANTQSDSEGTESDSDLQNIVNNLVNSGQIDNVIAEYIPNKTFQNIAKNFIISGELNNIISKYTSDKSFQDMVNSLLNSGDASSIISEYGSDENIQNMVKDIINSGESNILLSEQENQQGIPTSDLNESGTIGNSFEIDEEIIKKDKIKNSIKSLFGQTLYSLYSSINNSAEISYALDLYKNQSSYVYNPSSIVTYTPSSIGLSYDEITCTTSDDVDLSGWYIPVDNSKGTVLFLHGNGGNVSNCLGWIDVFNDMGLNTLAVDYRGFGNSEGTPSEEGTYMDAQAAWDYLVEEKGIPADEIIVYGVSLGGPIASWVAKENDPKALILDSTFTSIKDVGAELYPEIYPYINIPGLPWAIPTRNFFKYDYNTADYLEEVDCPSLIIHSRDDGLIPYEQGLELLYSCGENGQFLEVSGGHGSGFTASKEIYVNGITSFLLQ
jgi:fermentation-respiration switch protein FrsA (DUF1100 family)